MSTLTDPLAVVHLAVADLGARRARLRWVVTEPVALTTPVANALRGALGAALATENAVVERLNLAARTALIDRGEVSRRGRTYVTDDHTRDICLSIGDRVRLARNDGYMLQPDGTRVTVRNGMEGTIIAVTRHGITVALDPGEDLSEVTLPAWYVAEHVDYAYALTANKAQGMTVDHVLFAPSPATSQETAYTALSRGRWSNHIYAVDESGWQEALATSKAHTFARDQQPTVGRETGRRDLRERLLAARHPSTTVPPHRDRQRDQSGQQPDDPQQPQGRKRGRDDGYASGCDILDFGQRHAEALGRTFRIIGSERL